MSEWQGISTAPRDGTDIEVFDAGGPLGLAHFHCGEWLLWSGNPEIGWERVEPTHWLGANLRASGPEQPAEGGSDE